MTVSLRGCSHPPNPGRAKTRLFPGGDGETHCSKVHSNHPSKLACTSLFKGRLDCFQLRATSHPPRPWRSFSTHRPTDCFAIDYPGRALCRKEHRLINAPSKLRLFLLPMSSLDQFKRARVFSARDGG